MSFKLLSLWQASRPIMVMVSIFSVLLALAVAHNSGVAVLTFEAALLMLGVLLAHVGFNLRCGYHDIRCHFSSRAASMPVNDSTQLTESQASFLNKMANISIASALLIGSYFVWSKGLGLLFPILFSLAMILLYHSWAMKKPQDRKSVV